MSISMNIQAMEFTAEVEQQLYKNFASMLARKEYAEDEGTQLVWEYAIQHGWPMDKYECFLWVVSFLGNPNLGIGLPAENIASAGQRFWEDELPTNERVQVFLNCLQILIDPLQEVDGELMFTNQLQPYFQYVTSNGTRIVAVKPYAKWSQDLQSAINNRRSLLPMYYYPSKVRTAYDSGRKCKIPGLTSCCGTHFVNGDGCFDVINILNRTPLTINKAVLLNCPYVTKGTDSKGNLIRLEDESDEDFDKRCENHKAFLASRKNLGLGIKLTGKPIYVGWRRDSRLRLYGGYWEINPQGNDAQKSVIEFYAKAPAYAEAWSSLGLVQGMTQFSAIEYLYLNLANALGHDKETWEKRLQFVEELRIAYKDNWKQIAEDIKNLKLEASEPAAAYATAIAIPAYVAGKRIGLPIHLDATSSGAQWIAALTLDAKAAWQANLFFAEGQEHSRENLYLWIDKNFRIFCESVGAPLDGALTYKQIKNGAIVPWFYGSDAGPKTIFGKSHHNLFNIFMTKNFSGLMYMHQIMLKTWNSSASCYSWTMPDGGFCETPVIVENNYKAVFNGEEVLVPVKETGTTEHGRQNGANMIHALDAFALREVTRSANPPLRKLEWIKKHLNHNHSELPVLNNPKLAELLSLGEASGFYSLRIINEIREEYDIYCVPKHVLEELISQYAPCHYDIIPIHDCFMVRPEFGNLVREAYIYQIYKVARSEKFASWLMSSVIGSPITCQEFYPDRQKFANEILNEADYAIG